PHLPADRVAYTFTDLSPLFLDRAAEQFAAYPFIRRALLDIEKPPAQQGFAAGAYDIVIAANVLHATADLGVVVGHVRELLAPGGELFLLEGVAPERWVDLTFGLTEGWWRFTDHSLRPSYPLIAREQWRSLLTEQGFDDVVMEPEGTGLARGASQQALVVARAARRTRRWTLVGDADGLAGELAGRLRARGDAVECVPADTGSLSVPAGGDIVYLGALPLADLAVDDPQGAARAESLACSVPIAWLAQVAQSNSAVRSWLVTRGAQPVQGQASAGARWQAPLWGVGRVFSLERPANHAALLDLPPTASNSTCADLLLEAFDGADSEDQIAWRGDRRYVARVESQQAPQASRLQLHADATYLITGGFGGLGA
ncbi:MAG TPA: methyltransferase, partial [Polyangiales bacterium]|nr:methyltransferase [Polyangiales bacterium]